MVIQSFWLDLWSACLMLIFLVIWSISEWAMERSVSAQSQPDLPSDPDRNEDPVLYVIPGGNHCDKNWHKFIALDEEAS